MSQLTEMLGCEYPIIQGPVGTLNDPKMISAVSNAGGYGMLALGFIQDPDDVKLKVKEIKELTDKPFGANLMLTNPNNPEILKVLADTGVKVVTTSVGNPAKIYPVIHDLDMKGFHVVLALQHAVRAADAGVDGLVLSGSESGGLRSTGNELSTMVLVPLAKDKIDLPIVAAGGIADSRGYRAARALGAEGVQLGTRLIATEECNAVQEWKEAIVNCNENQTALFPLGKMNVRGIITPYIQKRIDSGEALSFTFEDIGKAWYNGDFTQAPPGAGQTAALISSIQPVGEVIREMVST